MPAHLREKLDGILGRQTAQETAPEAPQKAETRGAYTVPQTMIQTRQKSAQASC